MVVVLNFQILPAIQEKNVRKTYVFKIGILKSYVEEAGVKGGLNAVLSL